LFRDIEKGSYEAKYRIIEADGKERTVLYADLIDTKEQAENRLDYDGGGFRYSFYDVSSNHDKAVVRLVKDNDGDLYVAAIYGRPSVLDLNRAFFVKDERGIAERGTVAMNVTGSYFSDYQIEGRPHYQDWAVRELAERIKTRREFTVKTHRGLFHAQVGAKVKISLRREEFQGTVNAFTLRYKRDKAFVGAFRITEEGGTYGK
jgi:hypothetical protein